MALLLAHGKGQRVGLGSERARALYRMCVTVIWVKGLTARGRHVPFGPEPPPRRGGVRGAHGGNRGSRRSQAPAMKYGRAFSSP